jgi:hypothetical protein
VNLPDKLKQVIAAIAPTVGTALGGPFGTLAGTVLAKALGVPADDGKSIDAAIASGDPEVLLKLKQAEMDFKARMAELGLSEEKLSFDDRASARSREVAVKDNTPRIIAYAVIVLVLVAEGSMFFVGQPKGIDGVVLGRILGTLDSALMLVLGYYFGSSSSSARKDATISTMANSP